MKKNKAKRSTAALTPVQLAQLKRDRELIAQELSELRARQQQFRKAKEEKSLSGALRRAIHSSKILLPQLASRARTNIQTLESFLLGEAQLTSDVIDRLSRILNLRLELAEPQRKSRSA